MDKRIITLIINPALDKISGISQVIPNKKLRCHAPKHEAGGGGINVSRAIRRLGGESLAIFPGGGANSEILKLKLDEEHVHYIVTPINGQTRENITIFEGESTHQYRFIMPGPTLSEEECQLPLKEIKESDPKPDYIVASGSITKGVPENFYQRLAELAQEIDSKLIVDTSGKQLTLAAEAGVYMLKPNIRELGHLAGKEITSEEHQIEVAQELVHSGKAQIVVVSLGAGGALLVTKDIAEHLRTPMVPIRSKLGAGDSMVGGIVYALAKGMDIQHATRYGIAAGASAVMTPGIELCEKETTEKLYRKLINKDEERTSAE